MSEWRTYRAIVEAVKAGEITDLQRGRFYGLNEVVAFRVGGSSWVRLYVDGQSGVWIASRLDGSGYLIRMNGRRLLRLVRQHNPDIDLRDSEQVVRDGVLRGVR